MHKTNILNIIFYCAEFMALMNLSYWACSCGKLCVKTWLDFFGNKFFSLCAGRRGSVEQKNHSRRPQIIAILWERRKSFLLSLLCNNFLWWVRMGLLYSCSLVFLCGLWDFWKWCGEVLSIFALKNLDFIPLIFKIVLNFFNFCLKLLPY